MDSPIRWAGSKRRLRKLLAAKISASEKCEYIEPFCGSANVFFFCKPERATLSDRNEWLVQTLVAIRDRPDVIASILMGISIDKATYDVVRSIHYRACDIDTAAAYFMYLNRLCFNGIFRTNRLGLFNVPYSGRKTGPMADVGLLREASAVLQGAEICHGDFDEIIRNKVGRNSVVYLDPPYATNNSRVFHQYNYNTFGVKDISRIEEVVSHIDAVGGSFVLSYADVPEITYLKTRWNFEVVSVQRNIAGFAGNRRESSEVVISNF